MVKLRVTSHQDGSLMTGNYKIFPYVDPTSNAVVDIRPNWGYKNNVITYSGSQIWMGSEPFAAAIAPKNCFTVVDPGPPIAPFSSYFPLYTMGMTVTNKRTGEICRTTEKGTFTYQTCSGSCGTGTDLDPGTRDVSVGKNTRGGGDADLLNWDLIPVDWVKNGYYIRSRGSDKRFWGLGPTGVKFDAVSISAGWKPPNLRVQPYLKWGAYIGKYNDVGYTSNQDLANFVGSFVSGVVAGATAGFVDVSSDLVDKNDPNNVFFTSFPPQFQTMAYPVHSMYKDLQKLPSQKVPGGSKYDDKEYIFVIEPV